MMLRLPPSALRTPRQYRWLPGLAGTERRQRVPLTSLPAGQYIYQLVVDGQPVAAPQKLLVHL